MDRVAKEEFSSEIQQKGLRRFFEGIYHCFPVAEGFQNWVFCVTVFDKKYALRFTHFSHRSIEEIVAELDWIKFLRTNDIKAVDIQCSIEGNIAEKIETKTGYYSVVCFEWAPGRHMHPSEYNQPLVQRWGEVVGLLHKISQAYNPPQYQRPFWYDEDNFDAKEFLSRRPEKRLRENYDRLVDRIREIPVSQSSFGLIHSDIHQNNFHVHDGDIILFDFDGCFFSWFNHDLAVLLYDLYESNIRYREHQNEFADFLNPFFNGYKINMSWSPEIYDEIDLFIRLEAFGRLMLFERSREIPNINGNLHEYITYLRYVLENNYPLFPTNLKLLMHEFSKC